MANYILGLLRIRRGTTDDRLNTGFIPEGGEPVFDMDENEMYIGDGVTVGGIPVSKRVEVINTTSSELATKYGYNKYIRFEGSGLQYVFDTNETYESGREYHGRNIGAESVELVGLNGFTIHPPTEGSLLIPMGGTFTVKIVSNTEADLFGVTEEGDGPIPPPLRAAYINVGPGTLVMNGLPSGTNIDWGDGTLEENVEGWSFYHTFIENGTVMISSNGTTNHLTISGDALLSIDEWGAIEYWNPYSIRFAEEEGWTAENLITVPSTLPSSIIDTTFMFMNCTNFNSDLSSWDVSNVTNMNNMFGDCTNFNQSLNNWNVSNVSNMYNMFANCTNFNQSLNNWNVSNVSDMYGMFGNCTNFDQPLNNWNVSNVSDMYGMFSGCANFNQDLSGWCVTNITSEPSGFSVGSLLTSENKPVWGTCP